MSDVDVLPMLVLVHGAWHDGGGFAELRSELDRLGVPNAAVDLPGHGGDPTPLSDIGLDDYVDAVVEAVGDLVESGGGDGPVVLVGHSLGGITIEAVAERIPDRVGALVHLCAFLVGPGSSAMEVQAGLDMGDFLDHVDVTPAGDATTVAPDATAHYFYGDCTPEVAAAATARLVPEPIAPVMATLELTPERWGSIPRGYVRCIRDEVIPLASQDRMIDAVGVDAIVDMDTSHSPFLSRPAETADVLVGIAETLLRSGSRTSSASTEP